MITYESLLNAVGKIKEIGPIPLRVIVSKTVLDMLSVAEMKGDDDPLGLRVVYDPNLPEGSFVECYEKHAVYHGPDGRIVTIPIINELLRVSG